MGASNRNLWADVSDEEIHREITGVLTESMGNLKTLGLEN